MFFEAYKSILYSDTHISDIFISEYLPSMNGETVKIYIHCLFLCKYNKSVTVKELSKKLSIEPDKVKECLLHLENLGIISRKGNSGSVMINDLKEKEIKKLYRLKKTSSPEEAALSTERNKRRNAIITAINKHFFQGLMPPSWYTDIDAWFDMFKFDEDVMMSLFQYCYDQNALNKNYLETVAKSWNNKKIINSIDLDYYLMEYQKFKDIRGKIVKKLKLNRNLTEYENEMVEKWVFKYAYTLEIIEIALKKTTSKTNPNFKYIDAIITDWHKNGLKTKDEIKAYDNIKINKYSSNKSRENKVPQKENYNQRDVDESYYDNLYENLRK